MYIVLTIILFYIIYHDSDVIKLQYSLFSKYVVIVSEYRRQCNIITSFIIMI